MDIRSWARGDVFSTAEARAAGIDPGLLRRMVARRELHPLDRGWYAVRPPLDDRDHHLLRTEALRRQFAGRAVPSHHSALALLGSALLRPDLATVHLTRLGDRLSRRRPGLALHQAVPGLPIGPTVPLAEAIVQSGMANSPLDALVAADDALHRGLLQPHDLTRATARFATHESIGPVRQILTEADARIESPGESLLGHALRRLGYRLVPQFTVTVDGTAYRADFGIVGTRVLAEFDGEVKYADRRALFAEKRREDAIRGRGWGFARFVWAELHRLDLIDRRVKEAIRLTRCT